MAKKSGKKYTGTGNDKPLGIKPSKAFVPVKIDSKKSAQRVDDAKPVAIFELDGVTYSMSSAERAEVGLKFIELIQHGQHDEAAEYLVKSTLGKKAYKALSSVVGLESDDFSGVLMRIQSVVLPKGRGNRKSRRA